LPFCVEKEELWRRRVESEVQDRHVNEVQSDEEGVDEHRDDQVDRPYARLPVLMIHY